MSVPKCDRCKFRDAEYSYSGPESQHHRVQVCGDCIEKKDRWLKVPPNLYFWNRSKEPAVIEHDPKAIAGTGQIGETNGEKVRRLECELADSKREYRLLANTLLEFYKRLQEVGGVDPEGFLKSLNSVVAVQPGLRALLNRLKSDKYAYEETVRMRALSQLSEEEAHILGIGHLWRNRGQVPLPKDDEPAEARS